MEAYFLTGNDAYLKYSEKRAEYNEWQGAKSTEKLKWKLNYEETEEHVLFGDWQVCFQTYADLYNLLLDDKKITRAREERFLGTWRWMGKSEIDNACVSLVEYDRIFLHLLNLKESLSSENKLDIERDFVFNSSRII